MDDKHLQLHAVAFIQMLDTVIEMLGPNIDLVTEMLGDLGAKHKKYGVHPKLFDRMGTCLLTVLEELLGHQFDDATREAWQETYAKMSQDMALGYARKRR